MPSLMDTNMHPKDFNWRADRWAAQTRRKEPANVPWLSRAKPVAWYDLLGLAEASNQVCANPSKEIWRGLFLGSIADAERGGYDLMVQCLPDKPKFPKTIQLSPACMII